LGIFSGTWSRHIHGVAEFLDQIVIRSGLWVPLAALFFSRGSAFVYHVLKPHLLARHRQIAGKSDEPATGSNEYSELISGLYRRVIVMQVVIIFGASLSILMGSLAPLIILIVLKTVADLGFHLTIEFRARPGHAPVPRVPAPPRTDATS